MSKLLGEVRPPAKLFELGCGSGSTAHKLAQLGYDVTAVDPSVDGIRIAMENYSNCRFGVGSAYDPLARQYGMFDIVVSLEVVEHVFYPRRYAATIAELLKPGGLAVVSTPYHSYVKNLALSLMGKWGSHMDPLWEYGHIKLWSRQTLSKLFEETGLLETGFYRVGRIPQLAKSMVAGYQKIGSPM